MFICSRSETVRTVEVYPVSVAVHHQPATLFLHMTYGMNWSPLFEGESVARLYSHRALRVPDCGLCAGTFLQAVS